MDEIRIDSHKLIYHVDRVNAWLKGKDPAPIFLDVSPTSACNHRCIFCGLDFAHKETAFLKQGILEGLVRSASRLGVKSIMYAGEGEPLLHKGLADIIKYTKKAGIDAAVATNGVFMNPDFLEKSLRYLTWIRVSIDAGTPADYSRIHATSEGDFNRVMDNLADAVRLKRKNKYTVTIGTQFLLLGENSKGIGPLAKKLRAIGVDYLVIKPYSKHPLSINDAGKELDYTKMLYLQKKLIGYENDKFKIIFRKITMQKRFKEKPYKRCLGAPFWAYVAATGDVYPCHTFLGMKRYSFGNINEKTFQRIWKGAKRKKIMDYFDNRMDARKCRELCRLDHINSYLWNLKHPHPHVNFI